MDEVQQRTISRQHTKCDRLINDFIKLHSGNHRQLTKGWFDKKEYMIGGSEVAALMGHNKYTSFNGVIASKLKINKFNGNLACRWGTMFESIIERYIEIDCGTKLSGTDISVPAPLTSGLQLLHANSPDGYGVFTLYQDDTTESIESDNNEWKILFTDNTHSIDDSKKIQIIALLEFKCPFVRQPDGTIPKHYKPQIWSGLALSPIAHFGIFIDAVFRKCSILDLGPNEYFDEKFHSKYSCTTSPLAWGLVAIYAPLFGAKSESEEDAAYDAWMLYHKHFGHTFGRQDVSDFSPDPIDFGCCNKNIFEMMMKYLDSKKFISRKCDPCLPDGRGNNSLLTDKGISNVIDEYTKNPPKNYYLIGFIPWKLFEVNYVFLERRNNFLNEIYPLINSCFEIINDIRKKDNVTKAYYEYINKNKKSERIDDTTQSLFDEL